MQSADVASAVPLPKPSSPTSGGLWSGPAPSEPGCFFCVISLRSTAALRRIGSQNVNIKRWVHPRGEQNPERPPRRSFPRMPCVGPAVRPGIGRHGQSVHTLSRNGLIGPTHETRYTPMASGVIQSFIIPLQRLTIGVSARHHSSHDPDLGVGSDLYRPLGPDGRMTSFVRTLESTLRCPFSA